MDELVDVSRESSMFLWDSHILDRIDKLKFGSSADLTLKEKQLRMVGYLTELCYDLAVSPSQNVSVYPCFEAVLGCFGKSRTT